MPVWTSVAQLPIGNILDAGNLLLRVFPATRGDATDVASTDAMAPETSEDWMDEAQDTEDEAGAFDAAFGQHAECPGPVPLRYWDRATFTKVLFEC